MGSPSLFESTPSAHGDGDISQALSQFCHGTGALLLTQQPLELELGACALLSEPGLGALAWPLGGWESQPVLP